MVHPSPELFTCSFLRSAFFMLFRGRSFLPPQAWRWRQTSIWHSF